MGSDYSKLERVELYGYDSCPYCKKARALLESKNVSYTYYNVSTNSDRYTEMLDRSGLKTVPQIFIDNVHIGGNDKLHHLDSIGELDRLLA